MKLQNLQNIPRDNSIRRLVLANNPDEMLLEGDLSQAEARVVAYYAEERKLIELYESGQNVHEFVAKIIFGETITKQSDPIRYTLAKMIVHASNYGMGPIKMSEEILDVTGLVYTSTKCKELQNIYFQNFPHIKSVFHGGIETELRQNLRVLKSPWGWSRKFYAPWGPELIRQACAHYAQSTIAYIVNTALLQLDQSWLEPYYLAQMHDAILLSIPVDRLDRAIHDLRQMMTVAIQIKGRTCTIPVDLKIGKNWGDMVDVKDTILSNV